MWLVTVSGRVRRAITQLEPQRSIDSALAGFVDFRRRLEDGQHPCTPTFPRVSLRGVDEFALHLPGGVMALYVVEPDCEHESGTVVFTDAKPLDPSVVAALTPSSKPRRRHADA